MPEIWFPHLGIEIDHLSRVAFSLFGMDVYWYGLIIGVAILLAVALVMHEAKRTGQDPDEYMDFGLVAIILSVIGARVYYVIFSWEMYRDHPLEILNFRHGGLGIYGAVLVGIGYGLFYAIRKKKNFFLMADTVLPSLLLGQLCGRWGNFFNREAFGGYTDSLFAMRYLKEQVASSNLTQDILAHTITVNGAEYIQVHPTFLYESLWNLCLFALLLYLRKRHKAFDGQIGALYCIGYGIGRFWIEGLRTDQLLLWHTNIAVSQVVSLGMVAAGLGIYLYLWKKKKIEKVEKKC